MLARVDPRVLPRLWFPLGEQGKAETRAEAHAAGLAAATRPESQEACFLAGGDYRDFLSRHGLESREGPVLDAEGRELGRARRLWPSRPASGAASASPPENPSMRSEQIRARTPSSSARKSRSPDAR
jgi:hypothetical protein